MPDPHFIIIPLDARPVCYQQVLDLAEIAGLKVTLPPEEFLGVLKQPAPFDRLWEWWQQTLSDNPESAVILSMDTVAYGGLIAGRVNTESLEELKFRARHFMTPLRPGHRPRYGFSSILRIPNYNNDEEEPEYWNQYGKALYQLSERTHLEGQMPEALKKSLPPEVLQDFMVRRGKNYQLNQTFLTLLETGVLDFLIYGQDDTGQYGLNVQEASFLKETIENRHLQGKAHIQTGADEVALILLARALWSQEIRPLHVYPWFFPEAGSQVIARFDGLPIRDVVMRQIQTLGGIICQTPEAAELILMVNTPSEKMGDHCSQEVAVNEHGHLSQLVEALRQWMPQKQVALADVVYANGADPETIRQCLAAKLPLEKLAGYAGWNTPGNTIGTALAMGAVITWAEQHQRLNTEARHRLLLKRFLDDWVYQSEVRTNLRMRFQTLPPEEALNSAMREGVDVLKDVFDLPDVTPHFTFPCQRTFEIAVTLS